MRRIFRLAYCTKGHPIINVVICVHYVRFFSVKDKTIEVVAKDAFRIKFIASSAGFVQSPIYIIQVTVC